MAKEGLDEFKSWFETVYESVKETIDGIYHCDKSGWTVQKGMKLPADIIGLWKGE